MKDFYLLLFFFTISFMTSCSDDDNIPTIEDSNITQDNYYVKYNVEEGIQISYAARTDRNITYVDIDGSHSITVTNKEWEGTYGPFKKGKKIMLQLSTPSQYNRNASVARISVSKNKEPFVIKAEAREVEETTLSYTIDF